MGKFRTTKIPFGEYSVRQNFHTVKNPDGGNSVRRKLRTAKNPYGGKSYCENSHGKIPATKARTSRAAAIKCYSE